MNYIRKHLSIIRLIVFFPFLSDSVFFLPDWGLWWQNDIRYEKNKLNCFFSDSCWSHPDPPERVWWKRQRNKTITRLEKEVEDNNFWKKEYPPNRLFNPWTDCVWKKRSVPFVDPFYVTELRAEGHTCACESQLQHYLHKELDWEATVDKITTKLKEKVERKEKERKALKRKASESEN